ncbi:uncharacterized protein [Littorina saxatilis]|uniref:Uncharacterized protein n=1 Tax=Littorina saxatilis TaxID=31220 RepID=A0AAN9APS9_9CAEN
MEGSSKVQSSRVCNKLALCMMMIAVCSHRPTSLAGADIDIPSMLQHPHGKIQIICSFPQRAVLEKSITIKRRPFGSDTFRRIGLTNCTHHINYLPDASSVSAFQLNGSVVYTFNRARCKDAGVYECETVFSMTKDPVVHNTSVDRAVLHMLPGVVFMMAEPHRLTLEQMMYGTELTINCSFYTTLTEASWYWMIQYRSYRNATWSSISPDNWTVTEAPPPYGCCYFPWKVSVVLSVDRLDIGKGFRCCVFSNYSDQPLNSSSAIFNLTGFHPHEENVRMTVLTIVLITFAVGVIVLGAIFIVRTSDVEAVESLVIEVFTFYRRPCPCVVERRHSNPVRRAGGQRRGARRAPRASGGAATAEAGGEDMGHVFSPRPAGDPEVAAPPDTPGNPSCSRSPSFIPNDKWIDHDSPGAEDIIASDSVDNTQFIDEVTVAFRTVAGSSANTERSTNGSLCGHPD